MSLKHEAQYYGLGPLVKRLTLCEELDECACGDVLFHALLPPPALPQSDGLFARLLLELYVHSNSANIRKCCWKSFP